MTNKYSDGHPPKPSYRSRLVGSCLVGWIACVAIAIVACPARAQVASQIVPQSFAPSVQGGLGGGLDVGASPGLDTPKGAERLFVTLRSVVVEGSLPALADRADDIRARLSSKRVSGADIFAAAGELEAAFARAGYVLARVTLPRQKLVDGATLRLVVVDGFIKRVEVKNLPEQVRGRMAVMLAPLVGVRGLMRPSSSGDEDVHGRLIDP